MTDSSQGKTTQGISAEPCDETLKKVLTGWLQSYTPPTETGLSKVQSYEESQAANFHWRKFPVCTLVRHFLKEHRDKVPKNFRTLLAGIPGEPHFSETDALEFLKNLEQPPRPRLRYSILQRMRALDHWICSNTRKLGPTWLVVASLLSTVAILCLFAPTKGLVVKIYPDAANWAHPDFKATCAIFASVATAGFLLYRREWAPRIEFDLEAESLSVLDGHRVVQISAILENKGNIRQDFDTSRFTFSVHILDGSPRAKALPNGAAKVNMTKHYSNALWVGRNWDKTHIEPGIKQTYRTCIVLPLTVRVVQLESRFFYWARDDWHTASKAFALPD